MKTSSAKTIQAPSGASSFQEVEFIDPSLGNTHSQLGIQVDVVVPGQPVGGAQLSLRQCHCFRETRGCPIDRIDHPLGGHDILITLDLHRSIVDPGKALPDTLPWL